MGVTLAEGVMGGVLDTAETAGVPVTETLFSAAISLVAETNSVDTFGDASIGADGDVTMAAELVDAVEESDTVGQDVEGGCDAHAALGLQFEVACVEAVERLEALAIWVTVGAQVTAAGAEIDTCSNEVDPVLMSVAQFLVSAEGQNKVAEAGEG